MSGARPSQRIEWIALDRITVVNPRSRNKKTFKEITENIAQIGLKRPITVTRRIEAEGPFYDLVCGQGRLEAYQALGQVEVPALVVSADAEDCLIASLVQNCARRQHNAFDLLQDIGGMREADDHNVQRALQTAYEKGLLRGRKLLAAKRLVEARRRRGKSLASREARPSEKLSATALVRAYQEDAERKRDMIRRANMAKDRLMLITEALRRLSKDAPLMAIIQAEKLDTMPEKIAARLGGRASA